MAWQQGRECQLVAAERGWGCCGGCRGPALPFQGVLGAHTILGFSAYAQEFFLCPLPLPPLHSTLPWLLLDLWKGAPGSQKSCAPDLRPPGAWTGLFCPLPEPRAQARQLPQGALSATTLPAPISDLLFSLQTVSGKPHGPSRPAERGTEHIQTHPASGQGEK